MFWANSIPINTSNVFFYTLVHQKCVKQHTIAGVNVQTTAIEINLHMRINVSFCTILALVHLLNYQSSFGDRLRIPSQHLPLTTSAQQFVIHDTNLPVN